MKKAAVPAVKYPPVFQYSQNNLQDYVDCQRRFQLRHLLRQEWPAPLLEPLRDAERDRRMGEQFHRLIERFYLGLPVELPDESPLTPWWNAFRIQRLKLPGTIRKPEALYSIPFKERRLTAKFDLVAIEPGMEVVLVDWKTSRFRPTRPNLAARMQTLVYLYVATEALAVDFGMAIPPAAVKLIYWFANAPDEPEIFEYSSALHKDGKRRLEKLIKEIEGHTEPIWPLTADLNQCRQCNYRSLCERGVEAASINERDAFESLDAAEPVPEIEL